jgi:hypothetical protein
MKQGAYIFSIMIFVVLLVYAAVNAQETTPTPYPLAPSFHWQAFPVDLYCENIGGISEGPTWGDVTIGISSVEDLKGYVNTIDNYTVTQYTNFVYFERIPNVLDGSGIPPLIEACSDIGTQTVTALRVSINRSIYIQDMVAKYDAPDIVTWSNSNISRVAFWFNKGIAALVYILEKHEIMDYGEIGIIVYFPFQMDEDFEERWPYNQTNSENPVDHGDSPVIPPPSEAQNPFDFDAMVATITAQPSRTPTPTFAPLSSTPTATPTP